MFGGKSLFRSKHVLINLIYVMLSLLKFSKLKKSWLPSNSVYLFTSIITIRYNYKVYNDVWRFSPVDLLHLHSFLSRFQVSKTSYLKMVSKKEL